MTEAEADEDATFREQNGEVDPRIGSSAPSLPGNLVRFALAPFAWTFDIPSSGAWQLPGMWLWYAILPGAALGLIFVRRSRAAVIALLVTSGMLALAMIAAGRGDSVRHREMIVPAVLLLFALFLEHASKIKRPAIAVYVIFMALLLVGATYHRHTLKVRGLISATRPDSASFPRRS